MKYPAVALWLCALLVTVASPSPAQISNFKHVVVVIQENRSTDNLFYSLCLPPYGSTSSCSTTPTGSQYNIQFSNWLDSTSPTGVTQPSPVDLAGAYDMGHLHHSFVQQCDKDSNGKCRMDGDALVVCTPSDVCAGVPHPGFTYVDNSTGILNPYLDIATQYGFANYMFQTNQGPSYPAHQYLFGATAAPSADDDHIGTFMSNNGNGPTGNSGCYTVNDGSILIQLIDANGVENPSNKVYPCFDHDTLVDLLQPAGVTWRYYTSGAKSIFTAPNSITHLCNFNGTTCTGSQWQNVDVKSSDVLTDIANCNLQQVSWVVPTGDNSDHADSNTGGGPAWIASIVNAIGNSYSNSSGKCDYWGSNKKGDETAIIVLWDDWGGWYDHEPPHILKYPQGGSQLGFRVPTLVVSAFTPVHYVSNNRHDFGSLIRFIEQNYGIAEGALTFADARSATDMKTFFNLRHVPRVFVTIASPKDADFFVNDTRPQTDPDDY
ncbi:MAG: hypothetical protein H0X25_13165 [Acidobacteriales bacterium]|nr:hypothetical protein [Terriglobales bacterium]